MRIFISYSSKDSDEALAACKALEEGGNACFIAPRDIQTGKEYAEEIVNGIDAAEAMILLLSENSNRSPHVLREVERAVSKGIPILICKLEEVELSKSMEYFLMTHQWIQVERNKEYRQILMYIENLKMQNVSGEKGKRKPEQTKVAREKKGLLKKLLITMLSCILLVVGIFVGIDIFSKAQEKARIEQWEVGDSLVLGTYNDAPITWRILKIQDDGTAVLIAKNILTMKAYDAAESGTYNSYQGEDYWKAESEADTNMELQVMVRGNSDWSVSNIRTWLNSEEEVVTYLDQAPRTSAMAEMKNGYHNEPGFLYGFTDEELAVLQERECITSTNALAEDATIVTTDRVFLLSLEELEWFEEAGMSLLAVPTPEAIEKDESNWYAVDMDAYGVEEYCWWLREPVVEASAKCYLVGNGYYEDNLWIKNAGAEGFGVRPAIVVDLSKEILVRNPYIGAFVF